MTVKVTKSKSGDPLAERVREMSGIKIDTCLQCRRCSNGCPVAQYTASSPSEIIRAIQLGAPEKVLNSDFIWNCASCSTCYTRCPMKINMAGVIDSLRVIASEKNTKKPAGNMPLINRLLLGTMEKFGRTYDLGAMMLYKAGTFTWFRDTGKFPMILMKGKIALLPSKGADKAMVKQIFRKTAKAGKK